MAPSSQDFAEAIGEGTIVHRVVVDRRAAAVLASNPSLDRGLTVWRFFEEEPGRWVDWGGSSVQGGKGSGRCSTDPDRFGWVHHEHGDETDRWLTVEWIPPRQDDGS